MNTYVKIKEGKRSLQIPFEGYISPTYRCLNNCSHCWISLSANEVAEEELSFLEIKRLIDEARQLGCNRWHISGGEPMLRDDFIAIFEYITNNSLGYSLNTTGMMITKEIANLMKRKGSKLISLYGSTAEVHDEVTRSPGSFEKVIRGMSYLREAGAGFIVQVVPMKSNYHQIDDMLLLADKFSMHKRFGAKWLYLSASGCKSRNADIKKQRLDPREAAKLICSGGCFEEKAAKDSGSKAISGDEGLFDECIINRQSFFMNPYGKMSFCSHLVDSDFYYDFKTGNILDYWDRFRPSLKGKVKVDESYTNNCGSCQIKDECSWCPAYAYLEKKDHTAKIQYLCDITKEKVDIKTDWQNRHCQYYELGGFIIKVESEKEMNEALFHPKLEKFRRIKPVKTDIVIKHFFHIPHMDDTDKGEKVFEIFPWTIFKKNRVFIYEMIGHGKEKDYTFRRMIVDEDYTRVNIYHGNDDYYSQGDIETLSLLPTDQIFMAPFLANNKGFFVHSCGVNIGGQGVLLVGHSGYGKSTLAMMLERSGEVLSDERIAIREEDHLFKMYGTWSNGEAGISSAGCVELKYIIFINKSDKNQLVEINSKKEVLKRLTACIIRPFVTHNWWENTLSLVDDIIGKTAAQVLYFDRTTKAVELLEKLCSPKGIL
jgi:MoaA/NifB/PqqE/SkfB family radical SAM enzyme